MIPNLAEPSPYAMWLFGKLDLPKRTPLSFRLIKKDVMEMGSNKCIIDDPFFNQAVIHAYSAFRVSRVQPYHLNDIFFLPLDIRTSSPGLPWQPDYKSKGDVMDDSDARRSIRWFWHRIKSGEEIPLPDCKVLYRSHFMDGDKPKIRAVYGYSATVTFAEAQFALPLIEKYKFGETPLAYGYEMLNRGAFKLREELRHFKFFGCFDFSKFDKTVSKQLIEHAFDILSQNIDFTKYRDHGVPDARRLYRVWNVLKDYFIYTRLRLPNGERYRKSAGVPSGSYFTQMVDSIVNYIILTYSWLKVYGHVPEYIKVFGDDSVIGTLSAFDTSKIAQVIDHCGMKINVSKSLATSEVDEVEFLGFCIANGLPHRSFNKWMASLYLSLIHI